MKIYSIIRIGDEYVVQAGEKSILRLASRRRAARLIVDAAELLELQEASQFSLQTQDTPSIAPDLSEVP
jgi:hypothetical protein